MMVMMMVMVMMVMVMVRMMMVKVVMVMVTAREDERQQVNSEHRSVPTHPARRETMLVGMLGWMGLVGNTHSGWVSGWVYRYVRFPPLLTLQLIESTYQLGNNAG